MQLFTKFYKFRHLVEVFGWGGRIRTYDLLYQKQLPYH